MRDPEDIPHWKVLYVSYDGMTDPLGESQVIPYLLGLADRGFDFHLLSFEKPERFAAGRGRIEALLKQGRIEWVPMSFTARPRLLAKAYDALRLKWKIRALHREVSFDLVHCRSYPAADAALSLKRRAGVPYLFDMRGFWVDERAEGGIWDTSRALYAALYRHFKRREKAYLREASGVVTLSEAAVREMATWEGLRPLNTDVIPCAVDTQMFSATDDPIQRAATREELTVPSDAFVVGFLGSIGSWYLLDDMMRFFARLLRRRPNAWFVFITMHGVEELHRAAREHGVPEERVVAKAARRPDVPRYLEALDFSLFFIRASYSKMASCPTKLAEIMAVGLPCITNSGVGDVDEIIAKYQAGYALKDLTDQTFDATIERLDELIAIPRDPRVRGAREYFGLQNAVDKYEATYRRILSAVGA